MTMLGVDVSGHQTLDEVKAAAADPKNAFVIVKASEGERTKSDAYDAQMAAVRASGELAGAYHFAWPNQDPATEAANFVAAAGLLPGELAALDMERSTAGESWATRVAYTLTWCAEVKRLTGATPLVYVNWTWIKGMRSAATATQWAALTKYPCWLAEWSGVPGQHSTINGQGGTSDGGWPIAMHQYGVISGLDRDQFATDTAGWAALAVPTKEPFTVGQYDDIIAKLNALTSSVSTVSGKVDTLASKSATEHGAISQALGGLATADALANLQAAVDALPDPIRTQVAQSVTAALGGFQINVTYPTGG